jgi:hypothetical protein
MPDEYEEGKHVTKNAIRCGATDIHWARSLCAAMDHWAVCDPPGSTSIVVDAAKRRWGSAFAADGGTLSREKMAKLTDFFAYRRVRFYVPSERLAAAARRARESLSFADQGKIEIEILPLTL